MSPLASLAAVPFLALTACGDAPPAQDPARGNEASRPLRINGVPIPDGLHRVYECNATLNSPANDTLRTRLGEEPAQIRLLRTEQGANTFWWAMGHLDNAVHRTVDPPFPASARTEGDRTILQWNIHSSRVVAILEWRSPAQDRAGVAFDVTDPSGSRPGDMFPYRMRGECVENPRNSLATLLNGTA